MIRLLKFLLTGDWHLHEWEIINEAKLTSIHNDASKGIKYYLQCKHCGGIKIYYNRL
jgi:uncharacterized protein CbrC (UPF0167 family)